MLFCFYAMAGDSCGDTVSIQISSSTQANVQKGGMHIGYIE